ncbi:MAG: lectin-like protein [Candidatus Woesearchaeota archaeon]
MANGLLKLVLGAGLAAGLGAKANAEEWHEYNGHLYAMTPTTMGWWEAENYAVALGMDAHLVTINDDAENTWLRAILTPPGEHWMGLNKLSGDWEWISGEDVTYTNWAPGQPGSVPSHTYSSFNGTAGNWWAVPSNYNYFGIVESSIPEPSTLGLLVAGAVGVGATRRRK